MPDKLYKGLVRCRIKGFYQLETEEFGLLQCKVKGNLFEKSRYNNQISVGDNVLFTKEEQNDVGLINSISPKKSILSRSRVEKNVEQILAANVDYLFIVAAAKSPPFRHNLVLRMIVAAYSGGITPIIVVSKSDLISTEELQKLIAPYQDMGIKILPFSIFEDKASTEFMELFLQGVSVLAGHSGVGKSSLVSHFYPHLKLKIGKIVEKSGKGAHTTTYAESHKIGDHAYIIDTPGIREFGLWKVTRQNLDNNFPGFENYLGQCHHRDCSHITEPGCLVKSAVENGNIHRLIYDGYCSIYESLPKK